MSLLRLLVIENDASSLEALLKDNLVLQAILKTRYELKAKESKRQKLPQIQRGKSFPQRVRGGLFTAALVRRYRVRRGMYGPAQLGGPALRGGKEQRDEGDAPAHGHQVWERRGRG